MISVCKYCGGRLADSNGSSGDVSCMKCGRVQVENQIVSEVQFGETSSGAAMVQGSMVSADQVRANFGGRQNSLESKEQTLKNGKDKIRKIGAAMGIKPYITDMAGEWFRLALLNNFVQGRRSQNVLAACLYVACRKERTHHMLIDFSSLLQISVYSLGASFLKMVKVLEITNLPLADPSIFIQHFAEKLEFGNQVTKVVRDATRLAQRMANDWIHEGRRPAGIAGACVLLAARMNNFRRSHAEIVEVAHVAEETLQKRLNEFKNTNSAKLTVQQLRDGEKVESIKPPSYSKNRSLELKIKEKYALNQSKMSELEVDIKAKFSNNLTEDQKRALKGDKKDQADRQDFMNSVLKGCELTEKEIQDFCKKALKRQSEYIANSLYENPYERASSSPTLEADIEADEISEEDKIVAINRPKNLVKNLPKTADLLEKVSSVADNFDDLSDDELDAFLLNDAEIELKERVWTGLNQDFLIAQEKKRLKSEADELTGNTSGTSKKRRKRNTSGNGGIPEGLGGELADQIGLDGALNEIGIDGNSGEPLTAADSAGRMLKKKSFSKKINYATLGDLFTDPTRQS
ncbi:transcription factor IIIB 70 kDa subunit [[Candida] railenensis]|uniref:B-related factor 1 n=1 Tax=[Candida] railenensis TaxID=45579 RepID=A0A9P0QS15_9ASCO|nr:transcription factor IIIB 70 kDa subunit [[Candida] railenensis]